MNYIYCAGPGQLEMQQCPSDKHIRRIVSGLNMNTFRTLALQLGVNTVTLDDLEDQFQHDNRNNIKFMVILKWKEKTFKPSIKHLHDALQECDTAFTVYARYDIIYEILHKFL